MNAHNVVKLADRLKTDLEEQLAAEDFKQTLEHLPDEESLEQHADLFRAAIARYRRQGAEARRACRAALKQIAAERVAQEELHRKILADLAEKEARLRAEGAEKEAAASRLVASYSAALAAAEGLS